MALTDNATNGRSVKEAYGKGVLTLTAACEVGDLLTKAGALADGNSGANKADWVALEFAASGVAIQVAKMAVIGGLTGGTLGDTVYLSDTAGGYSATAGTVEQIVGQALSATDILVSANWTPTQQNYPDDVVASFGDSNDVEELWSTGDASNHAFVLALGASHAIHLTDIAAKATDWNVAADTHPSVYVHSDTTPTTDYMKLYHDATYGYVDVLGGDLVLAIAGTQEVLLTATALSPYTTNGNALGTTALMWADLFLASGGVINFDNGNVTLTHSAAALAFAGATTVANGYAFDIAAGTITTEAHGVDVTMAPTMASGKGAVGLNVAVTTGGTAGAWASGIYAKVTQGATKNVNGYLSGAEFEVINSADNVSDWFPLVLNHNNAGANTGQHESYIALREYGATKAVSLLWFGDQTIGTASTATMLSSTADKTATHAIRFYIGSTPYWILVSSAGPS